MRVKEAFHAGNGWPNALEFGRMHAPPTPTSEDVTRQGPRSDRPSCCGTAEARVT
jgi:hypothetical protein